MEYIVQQSLFEERPLRIVPHSPRLKNSLHTIKRRTDYATLESLLCQIPTIGDYGVPCVYGNDYVEPPTKFVAFDAAQREEDKSVSCCHFFEGDYRFVRVLDHPSKYIPLLKEFKYVVGPDFSQHVGWAKFACFSNSCWNKAISAYWQLNGVNIVPNVTWTTDSSYEYSVTGLPKNCMIAINSTGCYKMDISKYLWRRGYKYILDALTPSKILRYGPKMPYENEDISYYFESEHINRMRHGS